ncbi:NUDIX domain-containing protein [Leifsonia virtsii]|uniref:NUDIX domain-containing protein n=1 Tax=Leifsonia virtsii TaxID=3035915 RepID=A0ABT8IT34_9MICO|nr:NUDIX domain-containing protein [Leifsonia virtsii]MDN4595962.1 NUDIX domain-containing protein [Leifsonia virtsii]
MAMSEYVQSIRERIGNDFLLLPAVTAVIREGDRFLLARDAFSRQWTLIGGGIEPGEEPADALAREVLEETGAGIRITGLVGAYGGESMMRTYGNGDRAGYVTVAYECELLSAAEPDMDELIELGWFERAEIGDLSRQDWIDRVIADAPLA